METRRNKLLTVALFAVFVIFTVLVGVVDVRPIGPEDSSVGFAALNGAVHTAIGEHPLWQQITTITGGLVLLCAVIFVLLALLQWITRKSLRKVDEDLLLLIAYFVLIAVLYVLFDILAINYRPVLEDGVLEASYPSTHALLATSVMGAAILEFRKRLHGGARTIAVTLAWVILAVTVIGRLISGVHWFTDILGGVLLGIALVQLFHTYFRVIEIRRRKRLREKKTKAAQRR